MTLTDEERLHNIVSKQAYLPPSKRLKKIKNYKLMPYLSNEKQVVYRNTKSGHTISGYRGTKLNDVRDLNDDLQFLLGKTKSPNLKNDQQHFNNVKRTFRNDRHTITGHSRGGMSARLIANKHPDIKAFTFNEPTTPKMFLKRLRHGIKGKHKNVNHIKFSKDILSLLNPSTKTIKGGGHALDNFDQI